MAATTEGCNAAVVKKGHLGIPEAVFVDSYDRAQTILKTHAKEHKILAEALLTYETLDAKEIQMILDGKKLQLR